MVSTRSFNNSVAKRLASAATGAAAFAQPGLASPPQQPANVTTPTLSLATAAPAGTLFTSTSPANSTAVMHRKYFTLSGSSEYVIPAKTFPFYNGVTIRQLPQAAGGFGSAYVDFLCDDPTVTFQHLRSHAGTTRVLCDGVEIFRVVKGTRSNTAQAGAAGAITLDAAASATNNFYSGQWVHITSGTGSGQYGQIASYVGATKVATMVANWSVNPDNTSVFEIIEMKALYSNLTNTGASTYYISAAWGERRMRHYRVEHTGQAFYGIYCSSAVSTVQPAPKPYGTPCVWMGDSFSAGTADNTMASMARHCCDQLGWELINLSIGGTGFLNPNSGTSKSFKLRDRILVGSGTTTPNSWFVDWSSATAGTVSLTQGATTVTFNYNDISTVIQTAFDAAFGAGKFAVVKLAASNQHNLWVVGQGVTAALDTPMTADFTGLTAAVNPSIAQWNGDLETKLYRDADGTPLPFEIVLSTRNSPRIWRRSIWTRIASFSTRSTGARVIC
jgi:hypothetical protein